MSKNETVDFLKGMEIPAKAYSFYQDKEDAICIDKVGGEWLVYYVERGRRVDLAQYKTKSQALEVLRLYLLEEYKLIQVRFVGKQHMESLDPSKAMQECSLGMLQTRRVHPKVQGTRRWRDLGRI